MDDMSILGELMIATLEGEEMLEDQRTLGGSFHMCMKSKQTNEFTPQR